jgi:hypothetical protein
MKKYLFFLALALVSLVYSGCKKDDDSETTPTPTSYSDKIVLNNLQVMGDSVKLTWSRLENDKFRYYFVLRRNYKSDGTGMQYSSEEIASITDNSVTTFTDKDVPYTDYLEYQVVGALYNGELTEYDIIYSNTKSYERPSIKVFQLKPTDIIPDVQNGRVYVFESDSGKITLLDYKNEAIVKQIRTEAKIGWCDIGTFNGQMEIYVPRNDGWLFIYNALTLAKIDQIDCGMELVSVVYNNGKLFICGINSYSTSYPPIKVIDRASKVVISASTGYYGSIRFKKIPGSNTELLGIMTNSYYMMNESFDANGNWLNEKQVSATSNADPEIFELFPDGQKFITANEGTIYTKDLDYVIRLPYGTHQFSDFAFNDAGSIIYASCSNSKAIISYSLLGYSELHQFPTKGYPNFIFTDNNTLICLSNTENNYYYGYGTPDYIIEKLPMTK